METRITQDEVELITDLLRCHYKAEEHHDFEYGYTDGVFYVYEQSCHVYNNLTFEEAVILLLPSISSAYKAIMDTLAAILAIVEVRKIPVDKSTLPEVVQCLLQ